MSTQPWLIPDPEYMPVTQIGFQNSIDVVLEILEVVEKTAELEQQGYCYKVEIVNELRQIIGKDGSRRYEFDTVAWDNLNPPEHRPHFSVGSTFTIPINFKIISTEPNPEKSNAYTYGVTMLFPDGDPFAELLGTNIANKRFTVLAKGVDEYIAQL